jgi:SET domain-containing protein
MLLVNARAGQSKIHGIGLIAQEFIPKGTKIWTFCDKFDLVISEDDMAKLSGPARDQVIWYAYYDPELRVYVLSSDDDRFTNHSDEPNTENIGEDTFASVDIPAGTEITWDYRLWLSDDEL